MRNPWRCPRFSPRQRACADFTARRNLDGFVPVVRIGAGLGRRSCADRIEQAGIWAERAAAMEDADGQAHTVLGNVRLLQRRFDEAMTIASEALTIRPGCTNANGFLATCCCICGEPHKPCPMPGERSAICRFIRPGLWRFSRRLTATRDCSILQSSPPASFHASQPSAMQGRLVLASALARSGWLADARRVVANCAFWTPGLSLGRWGFAALPQCGRSGRRHRRFAPVRRSRLRSETGAVSRALTLKGSRSLLIDKNVQMLTRIADRHYLIERGRVVWSGTSRSSPPPRRRTILPTANLKRGGERRGSRLTDNATITCIRRPSACPHRASNWITNRSHECRPSGPSGPNPDMPPSLNLTQSGLRERRPRNGILLRHLGVLSRRIHREPQVPGPGRLTSPWRGAAAPFGARPCGGRACQSQGGNERQGAHLELRGQGHRRAVVRFGCSDVETVMIRGKA